MNKKHTWIGVGLDGVLSQSTGRSNGVIGSPQMQNVTAVQQLIKDRKDVRIVSARVAGLDTAAIDEQRERIKNWCHQHIGYRLPIQAMPDARMTRMLENRHG
jgi:hypothetical protein